MLRKDFPDHCIGKRLDAALRAFWPDASLRARRRMLDEENVLLNGRENRPGIKIKARDWLEIRESESRPSHKDIRTLTCVKDYFFFYKPAGLHSAHLAGSRSQSLESSISGIAPHGAFPDIYYLQRLDFETCGIICAAKNQHAAQTFRQAEKEGLCIKYYLALLKGVLMKPCWAANSLDTAHRKITRVLPCEGPPLNRTFFMPLEVLNGREVEGVSSREDKLTLALCIIKKGQRHQIRAHASFLGFPLYGDSIYGSAAKKSFYLEHFRLRFPGHSIQYRPCLPYMPHNAGLLDKILQAGVQKQHMGA